MQLPKYVNNVIDTLISCGFKAYAVGGCVRDSILSLPVFDYDVTTSATPEQVKKALSEFKIIETGIAHGTVTALVEKHPIEITTFRGEGTYTDFRHPDSVTFSENLEADLSRRDFTINAIAYNKTEGYVDLYGGRKDIERRLIRTVGNADARLCEDALRILRALRFSSCLGFEIEEDTKKAIFKNYHLLSHVSKERIFGELKRLICGKNAACVLAEFFEIFEFIFSLSKEKAFYLNAAKTVSNLGSDSYLDGFSALFFGLDEEKIKTVLKNLKSDTKTIKYVCTVASVPTLLSLNKTGVKRLMSLYSTEELTAASKLQQAAERISESDTKKLLDFIDLITKKGECYSISQLAVSGDDLVSLGFKGEQIGKTLNLILTEVILERLDNKKNTIIEFIKK